MYNLYTYEKKVLENEKKQSEDLLKKELEKKRKQEITQLSKKYEDRMKDFIFSMCDKPVILHKDSIKEEKNNTFSKKNFKFGEFKTDKQRLEIMESYKNKLKIYEDKRKNIEKKRNILKIKNHRNLILIQPEMRFNSRTKLEKIIEKIQKDDITNVDIFKSSLLEHIKKLKFNGVRRIKEFYYLIDKEDLKDDDIKKFIDKINDIEQCDANNQYNLKNYIEWKYHQNITNNNNSVKKEKRKKSTNNNILQNMGNEDNKIKSKNEYEILVKDDFKTHFKGASQYIEFIDTKNQNENQLRKYALSKKRVVSSLRLRSTNMKNFNSFKLQESKKYKSSRNIKYTKMKELKRPASVINFDFDKNNNKLLLNKTYKKEYSLKDLSEELKKMKLTMIDSMNKEINKSIAKDFMQKYNSVNLFDSSYNLYIPKNILIQNFHNFSEVKKDDNLNKKLKILSDEMSKERRKINNEKYKQFVKRFTRSIFGFRKKEIQEKVDEIKSENQNDYVILDGKFYQKKNLRKIANIIFRKCNYYNNKKESNS